MFYFLLKNPRCLKKVEEELLSTFKSYSEISDDQLAKLPYLHACINEMLRMAPAFSAGILQRVSKGASVDGIYIPRGVSVLWSFHVLLMLANNISKTGVTVDQYSLGLSEEHWESADIFKPERWFDDSSRKNIKASRPFLIGIRQCPGRALVYQILRMAVGKAVYLYDMTLMNPEFDLASHSCSRLSWTAVDLKVCMKPRVPDVLGYE
jgi:cytochrome P450